MRIGASSREIRLRQRVTLRSTENNRVPFSESSYIKDFLDSDRERKLFRDSLLEHKALDENLADKALEQFRTMFVPDGTALRVFANPPIEGEVLTSLLDRVNQD